MGGVEEVKIMLDAKAFGNAAALASIIIYFVCVALVAVAPELAFNLFTLTFHGVNTEVLKPVTTSLDPLRIVIGAVALAVWVWVTFYLGAYFYNQFRKK